MFNSFKKSFLLLLLVISTQASAAVVEAEGQAIIANRDIVSAREAAMRDASQQASMQAAVYVSSNQVVRDGILEVDNMQISTLGKVQNIELLSEKIIGNTLYVRIRADVLVDQGCDNGVTNKYAKKVAFTGFPIEHLSQGSLGGLHDASSAFPSQLAQLFRSGKDVTPLNASQLNLFSDLSSAATLRLDDGMLSSMLTTLGTMDVNYTISGVIRDISMIDPRTHAEDNYFIDLYNKLDFKSRKHLRNFAIDLFIHDGYTGQLVAQKHYQTAGLWNLDPAIRTGFSSSGFLKQDYGKKVRELQKKIVRELTEEFACKPFTARINKTEGSQLWINVGTAEGLQRGDKLTVFRRNTFYTPDMRPSTQLINTQQTLTIEHVGYGLSSGRLSGDAMQHNIRPGDMVTSH